ncbi:MAG: hypothetical protein HY298_08130 [Verrucomicrobia bacterium]|nr:hypothetical protein [Verrucomicrobiota bacterium]
MCGKLFFYAGLWVALFVVQGCQVNSERAIKMQSQSGKMNRNTDFAYFAQCKTQTPGGHEGTWKGALWQKKEQAMRDALDHNTAFPGHKATVEHY